MALCMLRVCMCVCVFPCLLMLVCVCTATGTTDAALKQLREENHRLQLLEAVAREANESHTRSIQQLATTV